MYIGIFTSIESKMYTNDRLLEHVTAFLESKGSRIFFSLFFYLSVYFLINNICVFLLLNSVAEKIIELFSNFLQQNCYINFISTRKFNIDQKYFEKI